jgi:hypothetical protein
MPHHLQMSRQSESVDISINFAECVLSTVLVVAQADAGSTAFYLSTVRHTFVAKNALISFLYSSFLIFSGHEIICVKPNRNINVTWLF